MAIVFPSYIQQYFWGDDLGSLSWKDHKRYIIQTLLDKGDTEAISWLFGQISKDEIRRSLSSLRMSHKSNNFWNTYLS